jgi:hypothetical protein
MSDNRITDRLQPHGYSRGDNNSFGACSDCDRWCEGHHTWWQRIAGGWRMLCRRCATCEADKLEQQKCEVRHE